MPFEAGKGEHHVYRIPSTHAPDHIPLRAGECYMGVDALSWYVNKKADWFRNKMASGTLDITLASGLEKYQVALGVFALKAGAKVAPVFDKPILPDRNYRGGPIGLTADLSGVNKDTVLAKILKSAATSSLSVVAGMVQTATLAGPSKILGAAGNDIISGVKDVLSDSKTRNEPFFDFSGIDFNLQPSDFEGPEMYILFHRGDELPESKLSVKSSGLLLLPFLNGQPLQDGAWLLLRIRRSTEYTGAREWFDDVKVLRLNIKSLVDDFSSGVVTKDDALKRLKPSASGNETLFDDFSKLRAIINKDGVLTEMQANFYTSGLSENLEDARKAIESDQPHSFGPALKETHGSLISGNPQPDFVKSFGEHLDTVHSIRFEVLPKQLKNFRAPQITQVGALLKNASSGYKKTLRAALL